MSEVLKTITDPATRILIVDDNRQYTQVLSKILHGVFGYTDITSVEETDQAFELLQKEPHRYQLLFVDYNFPSGVTGGQFLERLKEANLLAGKIAFLITSEPTVENLKQATKAGAIGVVAKPFDRDELRRQLEKAERRLLTEQAESF